MDEWPSPCLVVGGSRGVGRHTVIKLAERGVQCAIGYKDRVDMAEITADDAAKVGPRPILVQGDQASSARVFVEQTVDALGGCAGIVTTAVPVLLGRMMDITESQYRASMDVQVWGLQELVREALPHLEAAGGSVVSVSSLGAQRYTAYYGAIGPAKAALECTVRYLGAELGKRGVRVNAVSGCLIDDPEQDADRGEISQQLEAFKANTASRTPLRRLATPDDLAQVIVALLSSSFGFVTGQTILADGGFSLLG